MTTKIFQHTFVSSYASENNLKVNGKLSIRADTDPDSIQQIH